MRHLKTPADDWNKTIIELPLRPAQSLREMSLERQAPKDENLSLSEGLFKIRLANSEGRRESASLLIKKLYAWRGYDTEGAPVERPSRITLMADIGPQPIGTLTIGFDSPQGLLVDALYFEEIDALRRQGRNVCEFTKLAVDQAVKSKRVLASLFHLAYIYAHRIHGASDVVIEVNPRHVVFYKRMLGFEKLGEERMCPRVGAPAVLLHLDFAHATEEIAKYGGTFAEVAGVRSIYPFFFSPRDEAGITARLLSGK